MHLQEITLFDIVTQNVAQYPLHHVTYAPAKFDVATSRVGSHVVSVRIHCTEKWRTSFHNDVLSKSK